MLEINIENILDKQYDIKESCSTKSEMVRRSLLKYGQLKPILGYFVDSFTTQFQLVAGSTQLKQMKELNFNTVWVKVVDAKELIEQVDMCRLLDESVRDTDILKFANFIKTTLSPYTDQQIADELGLQPLQIKVLKDLLELKFSYESQKDNSQVKLFSDETT